MIPFLRTLAMFSLLPLTTLSAKLVFEDESLSYTATFDQEQTLAIFKFTNQGDQAVEILDMKASCGCTVPALSRRVYRPGESGEVRVTFKHSGRHADPRAELLWLHQLYGWSLALAGSAWWGGS